MAREGFNPKPYKGKYSGRSGRQKGHVRITSSGGGGTPPKKGCGSKKFMPTIAILLILVCVGGVTGIVEIFNG